MATIAKPVGKTPAKKPAAVKPAVGKPAARQSATPVTEPVRKRKTAPKPGARAPKLSAEQRRGYVEVAAYYIAERRGFGGDRQVEDWMQAEAEIDRLLREGILNP